MTAAEPLGRYARTRGWVRLSGPPASRLVALAAVVGGVAAPLLTHAGPNLTDLDIPRHKVGTEWCRSVDWRRVREREVAGFAITGGLPWELSDDHGDLRMTGDTVVFPEGTRCLRILGNGKLISRSVRQYPNRGLHFLTATFRNAEGTTIGTVPLRANVEWPTAYLSTINREFDYTPGQVKLHDARKGTPKRESVFVLPVPEGAVSMRLAPVRPKELGPDSRSSFVVYGMQASPDLLPTPAEALPPTEPLNLSWNPPRPARPPTKVRHTAAARWGRFEIVSPLSGVYLPKGPVVFRVKPGAASEVKRVAIVHSASPAPIAAADTPQPDGVFTIEWNASEAEAGRHELEVRVYGKSGGYTKASTELHLFDPPALSIIAPDGERHTKAPIAIRATRSGSLPMQQVCFVSRDGKDVRPLPPDEWTNKGELGVTWDASSLASGDHTVGFVGVDPAGGRWTAFRLLQVRDPWEMPLGAYKRASVPPLGEVELVEPIRDATVASGKPLTIRGVCKLVGNAGPCALQVSLDGAPIAESAVAEDDTFQCSIDVGNALPGTHDVEASLVVGRQEQDVGIVEFVVDGEVDPVQHHFLLHSRLADRVVHWLESLDRLVGIPSKGTSLPTPVDGDPESSEQWRLLLRDSVAHVRAKSTADEPAPDADLARMALHSLGCCLVSLSRWESTSVPGAHAFTGKEEGNDTLLRFAAEGEKDATASDPPGTGALYPLGTADGTLKWAGDTVSTRLWQKRLRYVHGLLAEYHDSLDVASSEAEGLFLQARQAHEAEQARIATLKADEELRQREIRLAELQTRCDGLGRKARGLAGAFLRDYARYGANGVVKRHRVLDDGSMPSYIRNYALKDVNWKHFAVDFGTVRIPVADGHCDVLTKGGTWLTRQFSLTFYPNGEKLFWVSGP